MTSAQSPGHFVFRHTWDLSRSQDAVLDLLADLGSYPRWWPQVRRVTQLDASRAAVTIRSVLPVPLRLVLTREVEDRAGGELRVRLTGDLDGYAEWRVVGRGTGCRLDYEQVVDLRHPLLRRVTVLPPARALLRANHSVMMRSVGAGLGRATGP
ncbi:SRPBCC family protein [Ornithinimicrobium sp. LYQ103]|uniref:SRPBCC family protein n=1 Tax=Ornithinimicrobium sp. LYQ103 TaxID=3378796 RepID=UPI003852FDBF